MVAVPVKPAASDGSAAPAKPGATPAAGAPGPAGEQGGGSFTKGAAVLAVGTALVLGAKRLFRRKPRKS